MQPKLLRKSCPQCGHALVVRTGTKGRPAELECKTPACGHTESVPIDIAMKFANAPELPDF